MSKPHKLGSFLLILVFLAGGYVLQSGLVLCLGSDGHVAIEPANVECETPPTCEPAGAFPGHPETRSPCVCSSEHPCTGLPLLADGIMARSSSLIEKELRAVASSAKSHEGMDYDMYRPSVLSENLSNNPALVALSTVSLLC